MTPSPTGVVNATIGGVAPIPVISAKIGLE
jgi:hypothetical protein